MLDGGLEGVELCGGSKSFIASCNAAALDLGDGAECAKAEVLNVNGCSTDVSVSSNGVVSFSSLLATRVVSISSVLESVSSAMTAFDLPALKLTST